MENRHEVIVAEMRRRHSNLTKLSMSGSQAVYVAALDIDD